MTSIIVRNLAPIRSATSIQISWVVGLVLAVHLLAKPFMAYGTVIGIPYSSLAFNFLGWLFLPLIVLYGKSNQHVVNGRARSIIYGGVFCFAVYALALLLMLFLNLNLGPSAHVDGNDATQRYWLTVLSTETLLFIYGIAWAGRVHTRALVVYWFAAFALALVANDAFREALVNGAERLGTAAHQFADIVGLVGLTVAVILRARWQAFAIYLLTIFLVLSINSRATVLALLMIFPWFSYLRFGFTGVILAAAAAIIISVLSIIAPDVILGLFDENVLFRLFALFAGAHGDGSFNERADAFLVGIEQLLSSPLIGSFRGDYLHYGVEGYYIHGVLELPRQLGLPVFIPYLCVILLAIKALLELKKHVSADRTTFLVLLLGFVYCLIEHFFARAPGYQLLVVVLGGIFGALGRFSRR